MVGIFSRFSAGRSAHRRTKSATEVRESLPPNMEVGGPSADTDHEIDVSVEFKPIEHPNEPLNHDQPVRCPLPDPSIINDGRMWPERLSSVSAGTSAKTGLPCIVKQGSLMESESEAEAGGTMVNYSASPRHVLLASISAPEHHFTTTLEDPDATGSQTALG